MTRPVAADTAHRLDPAWRRALYRSAAWGKWLGRGRPETTVRQVDDPVPGDPRQGDALFTGSYSFQGETLVSRTGPVWETEDRGAAWLDDLHGFLWIRDLRAAGDELASLHARKLVESWLAAYADWHPHFWRIDILGNRISAWLLHAGFLLKRADDAFHQRFDSALTAQVRHLAHTARPARLGIRPMAAVRGLYLSGLLLSDGAHRLRQARSLLPHALKAVPGRDPSVSPRPSGCVALLEQLITLRRILAACGEETASLAPALRDTASCIDSCLLGDYRLARFHGGVAGDARQLRALLNAGRNGEPGRADATGYRRMSAGGTTVLADFGLPPPAGSRAPLSFEMSDADQRLIVNCGPSPMLAAARGAAPEGHAAHSTLAVGNTDARLRCRRRHPAVTAERRSSEHGEEVAGMHRGYEARFGIVHVRRLALTGDGRTLTGTDTLTGRQERSFAIRFHLHPKVRPAGGEQARLVRLCRGARVWEFQFGGDAELSVRPSVYVDNDGEIVDTWQLVLAGRYRRPVSEVTWRLVRTADG